jgi:Sulfotransferase family
MASHLKPSQVLAEFPYVQDQEVPMKVTRSYLKWCYLKLQRRLINEVCKKLYRDTDRDIGKSVIIAGTGRSGTTWLADLISSQIPCRIMFEPFHPGKIKEFSQFNYFQYMRPTEPNDALLSYCHKVFTGNIRDAWIDSKLVRIFPRLRIIKDIRVNLFLKWIHNQFPNVPILFIIRHPCAVVQSRLELRWDTDRDITPILSQKGLVDDFLSDKMDIIAGARTYEEKHAVIWCISNLIPIRQFQSNSLNVIFYENLCNNPEFEVPKIFSMINQWCQRPVFELTEKPSGTIKPFSAIVTGENKIARWKKKLSAVQITRILSVVEGFGLDYIYGDSYMPLVTEL